MVVGRRKYVVSMASQSNAADFLEKVVSKINFLAIASLTRIPEADGQQLLGRSPHKNCKNDLDDQT